MIDPPSLISGTKARTNNETLSKFSPGGRFEWSIGGVAATDPDLQGGMHLANVDSHGRVVVAVSESAPWARLDVMDDGPGIASEDLPHVFERLYVARRQPERREAGSGLGLAIVRELVTAMNGVGRNNPQYLFFDSWEFTNAPGGISNGITSGFRDEEDIDYNLTYKQTGADNDWRWQEQWLPHASWYMLAVSAQ